MQVTVQKEEKLKRSLNVVVPSATWAPKIDTRIAALAKKVKLPGFRPGKVPMAVIKKNYGDSVMAEVLEETVQESAQKAMQEQKLRPAQRPNVDVKSFEEGKDLEFNLEFEVLPDVPEVDFTKISLQEWQTDIGDADIQEALERLASQFKQYEKVERAAQNGDTAVIDFVGKKDGEPFPGGSGQDVRLVIGSNHFIPGFEEKLIGAKTGEERNLDLTFPKEYHSKNLAGQSVVFEVKIKEVQAPKDRAPDDELAKQLGMESLEKLHEALKKQFEEDYQGLARTRLKKDLFDHLDKTLDFDIPESMAQGEFETIWGQFKNSAEFIPAKEKATEEKLEKEYRRMAERRVRLGILLADLGAREKIEVTADEIKNAVFQQARQYPGQEKQVIEFYQKNAQALEAMRGPILEEKAVDVILGRVQKKARKVVIKDWHDNPIHGEEGHVHGPDCNHDH